MANAKAPKPRPSRQLRVAILDTGITKYDEIKPFLCADGHKDFTKYGLSDVHGHGTNIAGLIIDGLKPNQICLIIVKYFHSQSQQNNLLPEKRVENLLDALTYVSTLEIDYFNYSSAGTGYHYGEVNALKKLISKGTVISVAAGNDRQNLTVLCDSFPACYSIKSPNYFVVGADTISSNYGGPVNAKASGVSQRGVVGFPMTGTSQATANYTNKLLKERLK